MNLGSLLSRATGLCSSLLTAATLSLAAVPAAAMVIYVDPVSGLSQIEPTWDFTRLTLDVEPSDSIENIMAKIFDQDMDILAERQVLFYGALQLDQGRTLADYNIQKMAVLMLASTNGPSAQVVPEPSTTWLVLLGSVGLALSVRRATRQPSLSARRWAQ